MFIKRLAECEEIIANDGCRLREVVHPAVDGVEVPYSLAYAWVDPGAATLRHFLVGRSELYSILRGEGRMHIGSETASVREGDTFLVPPGVTQWIENTGREELFFSVLVNPAWTLDTDVRADDDPHTER